MSTMPIYKTDTTYDLFGNPMDGHQIKYVTNNVDVVGLDTLEGRAVETRPCDVT